MVGKVSDYSKAKSWFFGHFSDQELLNSELVEVAYQNISGKKASDADKHLHTSSVEINIVVSGYVSLVINGKKFEAEKGDFWVIWPETIVEDVEAGEGTELVVIRAPSINDKKIVP